MKLGNYRRPLQAKLSPKEKKQVALILEQEGFGTFQEAAQNEEVTLEAVDVVDDKGKARYQLYLWPFGSAVLFMDGTTKIVGNAAQDHFELEKGDGAEYKALAAAFKGARKLGVQETLTFDSPPKKGGKPKSPLDGKTTEEKLAMIKLGDEWARAAATAVAVDLWGQAWQPFPKKVLGALKGTARQLVERAADADAAGDLYLWGFPFGTDEFLRYLGRTPQGPSDVILEVGGEPLPLWCAVSHVASGHGEPAPVLAVFRALPAQRALDAWKEMARGDAYDLFKAHGRRMADNDKIFTPESIEYHTRLFRWLADANRVLGAAGRTAARAIAKSIDTDEGGTPPMFISVLALSRHDPAAVELDSLIPRLEEPLMGRVVVPPIVKELLTGLPKERAAAVRARLQNKLYSR